MPEGFEVQCLFCQSKAVEIDQEVEYDWDECPIEGRYFIYCSDCGNLKYL